MSDENGEIRINLFDQKVHFLNGPNIFCASVSDQPKVDVESYLLMSRMRDNGMHPGPNRGLEGGLPLKIKKEGRLQRPIERTICFEDKTQEKTNEKTN